MTYYILRIKYIFINWVFIGCILCVKSQTQLIYLMTIIGRLCVAASLESP